MAIVAIVVQVMTKIVDHSILKAEDEGGYNEERENSNGSDKEIEEEDEREIEEQGEQEIEELRREKKGKKVMIQGSSHSTETEARPSLLFAYENHIADSIWNAKEPRDEARIVKLHIHVGTRKRWDLSNECDFVQNTVAGLGFQHIIKYAHDKVLINAFIKRFYPETNTFHLLFGEMGITIDEMFHITSLPVDGKAVTGPLGGSRGISDDCVYDLLKKCLGVDSKTTIEILGGEKKVRLEWLRTTFSGSQEQKTTDRKRQCTVAYILYTLGVLVCGDKSGNKVSVHFL